MRAATVAGLLGSEDRLRVFAAVALGARTIDEVAAASALPWTRFERPYRDW
jgi:hypothetical protein